MIWQFNPKKHQVCVPDANLTIPCVKSLKMAKSIMTNDFDATQWQCVVVSKSGTQMHNHSNRAAAEADAMMRCTKTATFIVYENGKPVAAFVNKKRLPDYKRVVFINWYKESGTAEAKASPYYRDPYKYVDFDPESPFSAKVVAKEPWEMSLDRADDRVRIRKRYVFRLLTKDGKRIAKYVDHSITIHKDGRTFVCRHGRICRNDHDFDVPLEISDKLIEILDEWKPGIKAFMPEKTAWTSRMNAASIADEYCKPNFNHITDSYQGRLEYRRLYAQRWGIRKYFPKEVTDESRLVPMVARKARVPMGKQFKKIYLNDVANIQLVKNVVDCGFKNPDNIINLAHLAWCIQKNHGREQMKRFVKYLIEEKSESWLTRALIKEGAYPVRDSARMANEVDKETLAFVVKESTNLNQIHETLVRLTISPSRRQVNRTIPYTDKERDTLPRTYGDITFSLPEDTKTLATIGYYMGICVGGYGNDAINKRCTIVQMKMGEKYIACIELHGNHMVQLKGKYNNPVEAIYKSAIDKWLNDAGIKVDTYDYRIIGQPAHSHQNYAYYNPAEFEEHDNNKLEIFQVGPAEFEDIDDDLCWVGEETPRATKFRYSGYEDEYEPEEEYEPVPFYEAAAPAVQPVLHELRPQNEVGADFRNDGPLEPAGFTAVEEDELPF